MSTIDSLRTQNAELAQAIQDQKTEIQRLQNVSRNNAVEIQTLVKYNQQLMSLIETELGGTREKNFLKPISEQSERQSDPTNIPHFDNQRFRRSFQMNQKVQVNSGELDPASSSPTAPSDFNWRVNQDYKAAFSVKKDSQEAKNKQMTPSNSSQSKKMIQQLLLDMQRLSQIEQSSQQFYQGCHAKIQALQSTLSQYNSFDQFEQLSRKLHLSQQVSDSVRQSMMRANI